jgi:hypothetical protein
MHGHYAIQSSAVDRLSRRTRDEFEIGTAANEYGEQYCRVSILFISSSFDVAAPSAGHKLEIYVVNVE